MAPEHRIPHRVTKGLLGLGLLGLTLAASACANLGPRVLVEAHPTATTEMQDWRTYNWMEVPPTRITGLYSEYMQNHVRAVTDEILFARGFQPTDQDPEFLVAYHASLGGLHAQEIMDAYGYSWADWYDPVSSHTAPWTADGEHRWPRGSFILDIVRASDNTLVWRGIARDAVGPNPSRQILSGQISHHIPRILDQFPPGELRP